MRSKLIVAAAAIAAGAALAAAPSPAAVGAARAVCGNVPGPAWTYAGRHGSNWAVFAFDAPCGLAKTWAAKLVRAPNRGAATVLRGPAGWKCGVSLNARVASRGTLGLCIKVSAEQTPTGPKFLWAPAVR
jgi:hypothetical protein